MKIKYKIDINVLLNFHANHAMEISYNNIDYKRKKLLLLSLSLLFILISPINTFRVIIIVFGLLLLVFHKKIYLFTYKIGLKSTFSRYLNNSLIDTELCTYNDGIKISTKNGQKYYKWKAIKNIYQLDEFIIITTFINDYIYLPTNHVDKDKFLDFILENSNFIIDKNYPKDINYFIT